jgi:hypothetical protein
MKTPAPDIYLHALRELRLDPERVLVVEDSQNGRVAARAAGLRTVVTVSSYTANEDFRRAHLVLSSLGDPPPGPAATLLADPLGISPPSWMTLEVFASILGTPNLALEAS